MVKGSISWAIFIFIIALLFALSCNAPFPPISSQSTNPDPDAEAHTSSVPDTVWVRYNSETDFYILEYGDQISGSLNLLGEYNAHIYAMIDYPSSESGEQSGSMISLPPVEAVCSFQLESDTETWSKDSFVPGEAVIRCSLSDSHDEEFGFELVFDKLETNFAGIERPVFEIDIFKSEYGVVVEK